MNQCGTPTVAAAHGNSRSKPRTSPVAPPFQTSDSGNAPDNVARPLKRFLCRGPDKPSVPKIHKVSTLLASTPSLPPPQDVANKLARCKSIVAIDVETHDLVSGNTRAWHQSSLGFLTTVAQDAIDVLRVVQLGWAKGACRETPRVNELLVRPDGFEISVAATAVHHISQGAALSAGLPLRDALETMVRDVLACVKGGCRIVSHHLAFDAGIIARELEREGLAQLGYDWADAVTRTGICTMDPGIASWVRSMMGATDIPRLIPMRLTDMLRGLIS